MDYDPNVMIQRRSLAQHILNTVLNAGFIEESLPPQVKERVFYRMVYNMPDVRVQVWTTVEGTGHTAAVRKSGQDAVRVCAVYATKDGAGRGIVKTTRINRTGTMEGISARMLERMRDVYRSAVAVPRCARCGAPTFISAKGNQVCADLCFKRR